LRARDTAGIRLSVLDTLWPGEMPALVRELDELGYYRYWNSEHHCTGQSASPAVMAAIAASQTRRLRVGSAGVLLRYQSPLQVAEEFSVLELFYRGRIDLGVARNKADPDVANALLDGRQQGDEFAAYASRVSLLVNYITQRIEQSEKPGYRIDLGMRTMPEVWICGTSEESAVLAGKLGVCFSFHHYLSGTEGDGSIKAFGPKVVRRYCEAFTPSYFLLRPQCNVAAYGLCANTKDEATLKWSEFPGALQSLPNFVGSPGECRAQLVQLSGEYGVSEIVIQCVAGRFADRLESYRLLADALALTASEAQTC